MKIDSIAKIKPNEINIFLCGNAEWHFRSLHLINSISDYAEFDMNIFFLHSESVNKYVSKKIRHILSFSKNKLSYYDITFNKGDIKRITSLNNKNSGVTVDAFLKFEINDIHNKFFSDKLTVYLDSDTLVQESFFSQLLTKSKIGFNAALDDRFKLTYKIPGYPANTNRSVLEKAGVNLTTYINSGFFSICGKTTSTNHLREIKKKFETQYADQDTYNIAYKKKNILNYKFNLQMPPIIEEPNLGELEIRKRLNSKLFLLHFNGRDFKQWLSMTRFPDEILNAINSNNISLHRKIINFNEKYLLVNIDKQDKKQFKGDKCVFITINEEYTYKSEITVRSISENLRNIDFYILHDNLSEESIEYLKSINKGIKFLNIYQMPKFRDFEGNTRHGKMVAARFLFNFLDYRQVLYLDSDIFVDGKIDKIFKNYSHPFYMAKDTIAIFYKKRLFKNKFKSWHESISYIPEVDYSNYLNSGVVLFNREFINESIDILNSFMNWLEFNERSKFPDQDFLNYFVRCVSEVGILSSKFNRLPPEMNIKSSIYHFIGKEKLFNLNSWSDTSKYSKKKASKILRKYKIKKMN